MNNGIVSGRTSQVLVSAVGHQTRHPDEPEAFAEGEVDTQRATRTFVFVKPFASTWTTALPPLTAIFSPERRAVLSPDLADCFRSGPTAEETAHWC